MPNSNRTKTLFGVIAGAVLALCAMAAPGAYANPTPTTIGPYTLSVFATNTADYTQPDSIVRWRNHIIIGFSNGVAKDGSDHKSSTIVEYSLGGQVRRTFSVPGHNDGLLVVGDDDLWSLQNEDGNPNLVVIDLESGHQKLYAFAPTVHGGGFDDMQVKDGNVLVTASNPTLNGSGVNTFPALVVATLHGNMVDVQPVLSGDAGATDIPTGAPVTLNLTDPDSLKIDPRGNVVLDDQADGQLIFIPHVFSGSPLVGRVTLSRADTGKPTTVDDTAFAPKSHAFLLVADLTGVVYRLDSPTFGFEPGTAYSASDTDGIVGILNLDNGVITPVATGFGSARGLLFVSDGDVDDE
jgi:hypothetical protein